MSYSMCVNCSQMVPAYEKYCWQCLKRHPQLVQVEDYWKREIPPLTNKDKKS